jgi:hypothetical protein
MSGSAEMQLLETSYHLKTLEDTYRLLSLPIGAIFGAFEIREEIRIGIISFLVGDLVKACAHIVNCCTTIESLFPCHKDEKKLISFYIRRD